MMIEDDDREMPYVLYPVAIEVTDKITEDVINSPESVKYLEDVQEAMLHYASWLNYTVEQRRAEFEKRLN